jgi:cytochrome c oxidase subunit 2
MKFFKYFLLLALFIVTNTSTADFPRPWQMHLQAAATPMMEKMSTFHDYLLWVIFGIAGFVFLLLTYVCIRFNKKNNPVSSQTSHNTPLEILWTVIPIIALITISVPSMRILYFIDKSQDTEMTLKITGHQWYWEYEYPQDPHLRFDSYIIKDQDLKPDQKRLLEVDNEVVLPINKNIKLLITSADVIHSWAVPSFGIKTDAVPGRVNETWVKINAPGKYYGQCSELCGVGHAFMPIAIRAVTEEEYNAWLDQVKTKFGG